MGHLPTRCSLWQAWHDTLISRSSPVNRTAIPPGFSTRCASCISLGYRRTLASCEPSWRPEGRLLTSLLVLPAGSASYAASQWCICIGRYRGPMFRRLASSALGSISPPSKRPYLPNWALSMSRVPPPHIESRNTSSGRGSESRTIAAATVGLREAGR
jgi:hypothetical protein